MREVRSKINSPKGPRPSNPAELVRIKHAAIYDSHGPAAKATTPTRNLSDPDPHPAASRLGGTISLSGLTE